MSVNGSGLAKAGLALATVVAGSKVWESLTTTRHDKAVKEAYNNLTYVAAQDTTVYADHISAGPSPRGTVEGVEGVPDIVVKSGSQNNLLVEIETAQSIENNPVHAANQLKDFSKKGYRRVLAVHSSDANTELVRDWISSIDKKLEGELHSARTDNVHNLL